MNPPKLKRRARALGDASEWIRVTGAQESHAPSPSSTTPKPSLPSRSDRSDAPPRKRSRRGLWGQVQSPFSSPTRAANASSAPAIAAIAPQDVIDSRDPVLTIVDPSSERVQALIGVQRFEYLKECGQSRPVKVVRVQMIKRPQSVFNAYVNLYGRVLDARPTWAAVRLEYAYPFTGRILKVPLDHFRIAHEK
jgi:hypothetical protein